MGLPRSTSQEDTAQYYDAPPVKTDDDLSVRTTPPSEIPPSLPPRF